MNNLTGVSGLSLTEKQKGIENHKKIADHLLAAAANHFKAATHLKEGNYEKAAQCAMSAREYLNLASEAKRENINA
jgi:hypothetical protein